MGLYEEAQRQLGVARQLQRYLAGMPSHHEIVRQEAIAFNYLNTELQTFRSAMLARPDTTFRALLAAPLRATTNFIAGTPTAPAAQPDRASGVSRVNGDFKGSYTVAIDVSLSDLGKNTLNFAVPSLHPERVGPARAPAALVLLGLVTDIAARGERLRDHLASFVDTAAEQNPAACRTYNALSPPPRIQTGTTDAKPEPAAPVVATSSPDPAAPAD